MWRMPAGERRLWREATTLTDLGDLTARWLTGQLTSQPSYPPGVGPDPETHELIPTLALACRAGYLTHGSQPGTGPEPGYDGAIWSQRAVVEGWISPERADELIDAAQAARLIASSHPVYRWRTHARRAGDGIDATQREGRTVTTFGRAWTRSHVRLNYDMCSDDAIETLYRAQLVTIAASDYGPDQRVWQALDEWATAHVGNDTPHK